ncbi:von Willebrand factor A domain-containing protein 2-like [Acipenser ruthenus]|uniref:von Willebrand factor A domain-containing protein 2-like n=1 Tax=Acipenser ruthenus TaxID=7906 RepID=UPI002741AC0F|nr:von Willebrand factor A domain-containing protein 2-like [Acipenser ruthenus]
MALAVSLRLICTALLFQALPSDCAQELHANQETIVKISTAGLLMQCSTAVDVLFLLDGSYSIGKGSFERSKHFAFKLCDALDINPERVRVGVIQYSSTPRLEFSLNSYPTKDEVKEQIKKLSFKGGSTQTGQALKYILRKGFPGGRNTTVPRILIVLTDGKSQGTVQPASQLKEEGITIFAVGIKYPRWDELHTLASLPTEQHVLFAEHFDDAVNGLYTTLTSTSVCTAVPSGCKVVSRTCERKTLETVKEFKGNFMCWKGSKGSTAPHTTLCPYYSWNRVYRKHQATCYRTICPDPCDSQPCHNGGTCIPDGLEKYRCVCPVGFGGDPNCAPKLSLDCSVDLLFLVEGSSNVSLEGFLRYKSFMRRFVQTVLTPDTPVNVGLAQYSDDVRMEMKIGEYRDIPELLQSIDGMRYRGGGTRTGKALSYVAQFGFKSTPVFADVQDDLPRVVVLMTDSGSEDSVTEPAKYTRDREIFIIGVGGEFLKEDLNKITGNPQRTITYSSPQHLLSRILDLRSKICSVDSQGCLAQSLDLVFALDASDGVGNENFYRLRDFVRSTSVQFDINRDVTQIGLVTYGRELSTMFALDTYDSGTRVMQAINQVPYIGGRASTGSALLHIHNNVMKVQKGARPGVNKAIVVITDGAGGDDAAVPSQRIRNNGISVFVVGIGDAQRDTLLKIAGSEDHMIPVASYEDLKYFEDVLVQKVCEEAKKAVNLCKPSPCMNDGICTLRNGSYRCECRGWEGPHCENRSTRPPSRGDLPGPAGLRINNRGQQKHNKPHQRMRVWQRRRHADHKH